MPAAMSSRLTAAAKALSFSFFRTLLAARSAIPLGRTLATATMNPASSSQAKRCFAIAVVRGTPVCSAWPRIASRISSSTSPRERRWATPTVGCSSSVGCFS
jgi:hypothetical protein